MKAGFLNIVKPPGMTSHDVVAQVRRQLPRKTKVGHLGTLDPAAAGVLPVAVGGATRLIPWLPDLGDAMKGYLAEIALGVSTASDDLEGEVLQTCPHDGLSAWGEAQWQHELSAFVGSIEQVPPQVSAIRKDGQRAYEIARKGETVELAARRVSVASCRFLSWDAPSGRLRFFLVCSSGTYVRSIARDLGAKLEVGGALAFLIRTQSGPFCLEEALTLEELRRLGVANALLPESFPFRQLPEVASEVVSKGSLVRGDFQPDGRYLAPNGLLVGTADVGVARVEAVFNQDVG